MPRRTGGFIGHRGLQAPDPPTEVTPTAANLGVSIAFTAPSDVGDDAITGFVAQVSTNGTDYSAGSATGSSSPIVVSSLSNGTAYTAKVWAINDYGTSSPSDASDSFTPRPDPRGIIFGGGNTSALNIIEYITISSAGNSQDFGDLTETKKGSGAYSSTTRGVCHAGQKEASPYYLNIIDYVTMASTGNATDFGDALSIKAYGMGLSNATRGVYGGGVDNGTAEAQMEYVTIASTGNATNFGNLAGVRNNTGDAACASPTRGIFFNGYETQGSNQLNEIAYITIGSTGNASDFGDTAAAVYQRGACSSETRAVVSGGLPGYVNTVEYVTIASTGNATDFGDTINRRSHGSTSSNLRGVNIGGEISSGTRTNQMDYITIATTGNTSDFGDLTATRFLLSATSTDHGGVQ
ncbi:fibronectin type III domain-containing protein [Hyphomonas sp.]|uniref:fibronectin type III domain-containing protein n=1 Tax=Hyphomonas sp. TaxID=87 RepID=UPI0025BB2F49|nr:fibronectin type III domain-containing protein [Hyphomonas sp.]